MRLHLPPPAAAMASWEDRLLQLVHAATWVLLVAVPLMGYATSSSNSDGVAFFVIRVAELPIKDDALFAMFPWLDRIMARRC